MGRSLFRMLHRRFGTRLSGKERTRRAAEHYERIRSALPLDMVKASPRAGAHPASVAIIGAGFAGCAAAFLARLLNLKITVYDGLGTPGGRVSSSQSIVSGRILEAGAELIGLNHPAWIAFTTAAGYALSVVTPDDDYSGAQLNSPLILDGVSYNQSMQEQLYNDMQTVFSDWVTASAVVTTPLTPWLTQNASTLDAQNLGAQIPQGTPTDVVEAIGTEFELNNTIAIGDQSWLASLAQFAAGGGQGFFDDTEVFRCTAGNQQLAYWLLGDLPLHQRTVTAIDTSTVNSQTVATLTFKDGEQAGPFDFVIVAIPVAHWKSLQVDGGDFPYHGIGYGPAIKYLAPLAQRFWIPQQLAPSGMSDVLGMTWEGTDNQADTAGFDLTVFAGGAAATTAIQSGDRDTYFAQQISTLYPGFPANTSGTFVYYPDKEPTMQWGYSCPMPNQVVNAQQSYVTPYENCLFVAGEHTSPAWFGFMEGALESGVAAAGRIAQILFDKLPPEWGGTTAL
ncbi:MAG TPA: FAD-dependent oxidoreductase [Pyrinomonadaceae bacterium]|nr:FAD-dependent oxidoreductase [Pyrinomonadaceae bacterium]